MVQQDSAKSKVEFAEATVKNGELYFPNKKSLTFAYDKIKNAEDEVIADYVDSKNFIYLRPIVTEKNENKIGKQLKERIKLNAK